MSTKNGVIELYSSILSIKQMKLFFKQPFSSEKKLKLRSTKLPNPLTVEAIVIQQTKPDEFLLFYRLLYTSPAELDEGSDRSERYILSSEENDLLQATKFNGKIEPAKCFLRMGIKSLTVSRKVQEIIKTFWTLHWLSLYRKNRNRIGNKYIARRLIFTRWTECYT